MELGNIQKRSRNKKRKRIGRGNSSGHGTYSGKGMNGQKARSGAKFKPGFEGGKTPFFRQIPKKRGFKSVKPEQFAINVELLEKHFKNGDKISKEDLYKKRLIKSPKAVVKILGEGDLKKKLIIEADLFSANAAAKIKKAGGEIKGGKSLDQKKTQESIKKAKK